MLIWVIIVYNRCITNIIEFFFIMEIKFTDAELETISAALDDYVYYDSEDLSEDELIGGIPVIDRIDSIQDKIEKLLTSNRG